MELDPEHHDALNNLAWLLLEGGERLDEAEELARRAVAVGDPDGYLALDTLGRIQAARGRCREAVEAFARAAEAAPPESPELASVEEAATEAARACESGVVGAE